MSVEIHETIQPLVRTFVDRLYMCYWRPLYNHVSTHPELLKKVPGFLINPEKIIVYISRTHIGIEYRGSEIASKLALLREIDVEYHDYADKECNILEQIIGFEYNSTHLFSFPLLSVNVDLVLPTNKGFDKLVDLGWNFAAQDSIIGINVSCPTAASGQFVRIINGFFFDADESGLKTRHIKWLDLWPIKFDDSDDKIDSISFNLEPMRKMVEHDASYAYPLPDDYKFEKLPKINRFIELWGNNNSSETDITSHLAKKENNFILTMRFGATGVRAELTCDWQSEERDSIKPDFFVVQPDGYADIVEFKLPDINGKPVVGSSNRETFAAWLNSYISQTRVYSIYFDDPNNRRWFEEKFGFKVHKPRRWLVVGRRSNFEANIWREIIADYKDVHIMNFDDLIDGVVAQFYK